MGMSETKKRPAGFCRALRFAADLKPHVIPAQAGIQTASGFRIESGMTILLFRKSIAFLSTARICKPVNPIG
jgi:hypothetical protein